MAITMTEDFKRGLAVGLSIGGVQVGGGGGGGKDSIMLDVDITLLTAKAFIIKDPRAVFGDDYVDLSYQIDQTDQNMRGE